MDTDLIDLLISQWKHVRPDLDAKPMRISGRLLRLARAIERRTEASLRPFDLSLWQFDVLAPCAATTEISLPASCSPPPCSRRVP